jgi:hypothetical protein
MKTDEQLEQHLRDLAKSAMDYSFMSRHSDDQEIRDMRREADAFRARCQKALDKIAKERSHAALKAKLATAISEAEAKQGFPMMRALDASGLHGSREDQNAVTQALLDLKFERAYVGRRGNESLGFRKATTSPGNI